MQNIFSVMQKLRQYKHFQILKLNSLHEGQKFIASELWLHGMPMKGLED